MTLSLIKGVLNLNKATNASLVSLTFVRIDNEMAGARKASGTDRPTGLDPSNDKADGLCLNRTIPQLKPNDT